MMKNNRHYLLKSLLLLILGFLSISMVSAQEEKKEEKVFKIKMVKSVDGEMKIDTTIIIGDEFDGDLKVLLEGEELLEKMEEISITVETDDEGNTIIMSSEDAEHSVIYVTTEEGNESEELSHDIMLKNIDADSCKVIIMTVGGDGKDHDCKKKKNVFVIKTEDDDEDEEHDDDGDDD